MDFYKTLLIFTMGFEATHTDAYVCLNKSLHAKNLQLNKNPIAGFDSLQLVDQVVPGLNLTNTQTQSEPLVVELLVICDRAFGDIPKFIHDLTKILDYLTMYFWDVNMRLKTLPSANISLRVTGVLVIFAHSMQSFIQDTFENGRSSLERILPLFRTWVEDLADIFPAFDLAMLLTNAELEQRGGIAYSHDTCKNKGSIVVSDDGNWETVIMTAHQIAHALGAPHDQDTLECNIPGLGYIMSNEEVHDNMKWFFSPCSDSHIQNFIESDQAACLRKIDYSDPFPPITWSLNGVQMHSMNEQCQMRFGSAAFTKPEFMKDCKRLKCWIPTDGGFLEHYVETADNSPCFGGGRCFRGKCRAPDYLIQNVESGECMRAAGTPFAFTVPIAMAVCPKEGGNPFERFAISETETGMNFGTPWQDTSIINLEHGDRCIYTGRQEGSGLETDRCSEGANPWHGWDFIDAGENSYVIKQRVTGRCISQEGTEIKTLAHCSASKRNMKWRFIPSLPTSTAGSIGNSEVSLTFPSLRTKFVMCIIILHITVMQ